MRHTASNIVSVKTLSVLMTALLLLGSGPSFIFGQASAQEAIQRSLTLADSQPSAITTYRLSFEITSPGPLGSIKIEFCENSPLPSQVCDAPAGFDIASTVIASQSGESGFNVDANTTANTLLLSRGPAVSVGGPVSYVFNNVRNATASGTSYARVSTYATSDATGPVSDFGGLAYSISPTFVVNAEVPPYLTMCIAVAISGIDCSSATGDYVNMGDFSTLRPSTGQTQIVIATNADNGYIINVLGHTMASGINVIPSLNSPSVSIPGTSQFGINLRANSSPGVGENPGGNGAGTPSSDYNQPDRFAYVDGAIIASHNDVENFRKYTVSYLVNVNKDQSPGIYSSTFTYTAVGNF
jgi:hypothetical protein